MFGVSHGALQFMTYEEMKNRYNQYRNLPIDIKLVSFIFGVFKSEYTLYKHKEHPDSDVLLKLSGGSVD